MLLIDFYHTSKSARAVQVDFFSAHQVIIGNSNNTLAVDKKSN